ncbi:MAG TPA: TonB-dependent receptor [bacterium]|nr:TonB-dependent receptor [bacterium]HPN46186.1 TonB-dependent receptor [bacterium]
MNNMINHHKMCLVILLVFLATGVFAGSAGKISGVVTDAATGEGLPGANIVIEGTTMGAASNTDGIYNVLNVPPGIYTLRAQMIGYKNVSVQNVKVSIDLTTKINFQMQETVLESGEEVTIIAERPMVVKDLTASTAVLGAEEIATLPVTEVMDAVELQAGLIKDSGGGLHIRGGRSGEISYWIDGMPVTDVYDGGSVVEVNKNMVQELQVVSGAFNAEYGQAMSGIVNIATKDGSNDFGGSITTYYGDYLSGHDDIFSHIDHLNPAAIRDVDGSLQGALIKDKLFFYVNGRYDYNDGYLYGQRRYNPGAVTGTVTMNSDLLAEIAPMYLRGGKDVDGNNHSFEYILGSSAVIDSMVVFNNLATEVRTNPDSFAYYYNKFRALHKNGQGDGAWVPMNSEEKLYGQAKLVYRFTPSLKLAYNYIYDKVDYREWSGFDHERDFKYNPDGAPSKYRYGSTHIMQLTHAVNSNTFYKVGVSYFNKSFDKYVYENDHDPRYVHSDLAIQQPYSFKTAGTAGTALDNSVFRRETKTWLGKFDLTSQVTNTHQVKTGVEMRTHDVYREDYVLRPALGQLTIDPVWDGPYIKTEIWPDSTTYHSQYRHKPLEFSAYIQDKMEFNSLIVNVGVRFDYFEPDGVVLTDESDPNIYNPIKPENRYHDYGTDGIANTHDPDGTENNNIREAGETSVTLAERQAYWYKDATAKFKLSPRLGVSFPVTDRGVIYFSYGHFLQIPHFERLYQNPDFELGSGTGNVGVIGNADLEPEQTVSGEIGLQQQLADDIALSITGYFRDIRSLTGTRAEEIEIFGGSARYSKFVNSDFGLVKGIILSLNKRFSGGLSATVDYTLQLAKGSNSDPEAARNALAGGSMPEVQLTSLDWDQKHTVNSTVSYAGKSYGVSLIAQYGSGLPYTPRRSEDITTLLTNSQRKPATYNVDMRAFKSFVVGGKNLTAFVRVFNLFDTLNEINVFNDTGRAGYSTDKETDRATNPAETINSLDEWYTQATYYSAPRRVEFGVSLDF